ncbi:MAG: MarR family transcriptional regulator [Prevotellaceae bacterium]|nr:MarR family transcriptional regulator [Prevotellaceae bacterium]
MAHRLILEEREYIYYGYRKLLTPYQFQLLKALAREDGVKQLTSAEFISTHKLKQASSVHRAIKSLTEKEMINEENGVYYVYDVFFAKWLNRLP